MKHGGANALFAGSLRISWRISFRSAKTFLRGMGTGLYTVGIIGSLRVR